MMMYLRIAVVALVTSLLGSAAHAARTVAAFTVRDHLKHAWQHELVFFPVDGAVYGRGDLALLGPDEKPLPHQWVPATQSPAGKDSIAFLASAGEWGISTYKLVPGSPLKTTDLAITASGDAARLENHLTGIRLGGPEAGRQGPIAAVRLRSGRWVGGGKLKSPLAARHCSVQVLCQGPIYADALVTYEFPAPGAWQLRFRLVADEPVILVSETFALPEGSSYALYLGKGWDPQTMFHRGMVNGCKTTSLGGGSGPAFLLDAWAPWWGDVPRGNWTSLMRSDGDDLLMIGCREPGLWVEPGKTQWETTVPIGKTDAAATFQLHGFARSWLLATLLKSKSVTDKGDVTPLPQQYLIRHGDMPLDMIKDYVLEWNNGNVRHPRLFVTAAELARLKQTFRPNEETLARLRQAKINPWQMDEAVAYLLATGDRGLARQFVAAALEYLQQSVDEFALEVQLRSHGVAPHHRTFSIMCAAILSDLALGSSAVTAEEKARIKAQLAYLGYTLASPAFHSPERGYCANPNMTTTARGMLGLVACTIPDHPQARSWAKIALAEVEHELSEWCDANGGWLEAPHYMTVSMDSIVSLALAFRESGLSDVAWSYDPRLKKAAAWLAKISTPPDPRLKGNRHMPEIGNTYLGEPTCLSGLLARIWRDKDPQYAGNMQWMWKAHGSPRSLGIGGAFPGTQGYGLVVLDEAIPAVPPRWASELFPDTGAVFRAHFPGNRETYLHYIQGKMHQHYDYDEGSFILWGKGQPLCEDFGYYGRAPAADHSRVDDGFIEELGNEGKIREFSAGAVDYLRGERAGWNRQILFVKDGDPLGPNYFVVRDSVLFGRTADWRLWIATDEAPPIGRNPLRVKGRFAADLIVFLADPAGPQVASEQITRKAGASNFTSRETSQRSLHVKMPAKTPLAAVLYPVMKDQPSPKFTVLADGRVVKIESSFGTDYAFLALEPFQFSVEGIEFHGKAGAVQVRGGSSQLSLPCEGRLGYGGKTVEHHGGDRTISK